MTTSDIPEFFTIDDSDRDFQQMLRGAYALHGAETIHAALDSLYCLLMVRPTAYAFDDLATRTRAISTPPHTVAGGTAYIAMRLIYQVDESSVVLRELRIFTDVEVPRLRSSWETSH